MKSFNTPIGRNGTVIAVLVILPLLAGHIPPVRAEAATPLYLPDAIQIALANNIRLQTLTAEAEALADSPAQVGALPDPVLSLNAMNLPTDTFNLDQEPMTQLQVMLSQKLPFPGKRELRQEVAQNRVHIAEAHTADFRDRLTGSVRQVWWQLFAAQRNLEIVADNRHLLDDFVEIAESKYAVGKGLQQDVLLARLELSRLKHRENGLKGKRHQLQASLNGLLNQAPDAPVLMPLMPPNESLPDLAPVNTLAQSASQARELVHAMQLNLDIADKQVELAEKNRWPDFQVGLAYADRRGNDARGSRADFLSVMFSLNLPLYASHKQDKALSQRQHERQTERSRFSDTLRSIETDIGRHVAAYQAAREQALLLREEIIPQAEQTVASMLAGYEVNKVDFLNVINGQIMLYNASIEYWNAMAEAKQALAMLAATVGEESLYE